MNVHVKHDEASAVLVRRHNRDEMASAYFSLSQTQRRLAHRYKREALEWEARGHMANWADCKLECRRLWGSAKFNLLQARNVR